MSDSVCATVSNPLSPPKAIQLPLGETVTGGSQSVFGFFGSLQKATCTYMFSIHRAKVEDIPTNLAEQVHPHYLANLKRATTDKMS